MYDRAFFLTQIEAARNYDDMLNGHINRLDVEYIANRLRQSVVYKWRDNVFEETLLYLSSYNFADIAEYERFVSDCVKRVEAKLLKQLPDCTIVVQERGPPGPSDPVTEDCRRCSIAIRLVLRPGEEGTSVQ